VALTGLSRSKTSLLLQCLAGLVKPASGEILIDGVNLYANLKDFRATIAYVPPQLALHENLTVAEILQDASRLRLPRRTSSQERKQRVQTVLETVGLQQAKDQQARLLSEVEKRKLSIAVELIGYPKLFLLDASDEPLTPFDEVQIAILMRELSRQGITVLHINPRARSAGLSDKIIFLAPGGLIAWFGPSDEALTYLKSFLPRGVVKDLFGLQEAIEMLVNPQERDGIQWAKRFKDDPAYQKYVDDPLNNRYPDLLLQTRPLLRIRLRNSANEKLPPPIIPRAGMLQKFLLLFRRSFSLQWRDQTGLLMLAIPPLVALIYYFVSAIVQLEAGRLPTFPSLLVFLMILTAAFLSRNEILKETAVYQRENRTSSVLFPYVMSKVCLVGIWAIYQGLVWTIGSSLGERGPMLAGGLQALLPIAIIFSLLCFVGGIIGLMVSSLSRTAMTTAWVILLTLPLLLFMFDPISHWSRLSIISLMLFVLLVAIQRRAASVRT
ncbi:MAG TPA: ATP-binding cassette domain-containing protein, partial [Anaerolineales bacterium]|nr:ATP-binding cassette domain-containing protein [Anaerolineales bacterium]